MLIYSYLIWPLQQEIQQLPKKKGIVRDWWTRQWILTFFLLYVLVSFCRLEINGLEIVYGASSSKVYGAKLDKGPRGVSPRRVGTIWRRGTEIRRKPCSFFMLAFWLYWSCEKTRKVITCLFLLPNLGNEQARRNLVGSRDASAVPVRVCYILGKDMPLTSRVRHPGSGGKPLTLLHPPPSTSADGGLNPSRSRWQAHEDLQVQPNP